MQMAGSCQATDCAIELSRQATDYAIEQSCKASDRAIEKSRVDSQMEITQIRLDATKHMDQMEKEAREHIKKVDDKLAAIPSESTVNEWARTATHDDLNDPSTLDTITTACDTANSSITALYETGATTIRNEKAKAINELLDAQRKALKDIESGSVHAVTTVTNKIDNTGAY